MSSIFGSGNVIKSGFDLIDSMHTSDEEEIQAKSKAKIDLLTAYSAYKIAQRYLAMLFTITFLLSFVLVLIMTLAGNDNIDSVRNVLLEFKIGWIMLTIIGFYFGGGAVEGIANTIKKKAGK
tara:strand:+ start:6260 stop:6625 length:366 start_codon:yes stop_codon:yes gene_type:complete